MKKLSMSALKMLVPAGLLVIIGASAPALGGDWSYYGQLSPEQQRALQKIYAEHTGRLYALRAEIAAKRAELEASLAEPSIRKSKVDELVGELNALRSQLMTERVDMIVEMRSKGLPYFGLDTGAGRSGFRW